MNKISERYCLRHAAGLYWLVDTVQDGREYISPIPLNEVGANIWKMYERGSSDEEICEWMRGEYEITKEQAEEDLRGFFSQLRRKNVDFGGKG